MDTPYKLNDLRRAADERRKAAAALTVEARRMHLDLAEIFEARAGVFRGASDGSNVIQLRPKGSARAAAAPARTTKKARTTKRRSTPRPAKRAS